MVASLIGGCGVVASLTGGCGGLVGDSFALLSASNLVV